MNAILLALTVISADYRICSTDAQWNRGTAIASYSYWGYAFAFQPMYSPWNAAVAELRANGPSKSRDRWLPESTANNLQELALRRSEMYATLVAAPKAKKAELRQQWLVARQELERARILASKELCRGSRRTQ